MENILIGTCSAFGASYDFRYESGYDAVVNDEEVIARITTALEKNADYANYSVEKFKPVMSGEDFSAYLQHVPGALLFVGAGDKEQGFVFPHHHPRFEFDEKALLIGMEVLIAAVFGLLE
jgi:amidohydrolase